jgi:hypothetical protein
LATLRTAHQLYRGPLGDGLAAAWVLSVRGSARRSYLDVTGRLVRHYAEASPAVALQLLEIARKLDATNENLYRDIIALQLRVGDEHAPANTLRLLQTQFADTDEVVANLWLSSPKAFTPPTERIFGLTDTLSSAARVAAAKEVRCSGVCSVNEESAARANRFGARPGDVRAVWQSVRAIGVLVGVLFHIAPGVLLRTAPHPTCVAAAQTGCRGPVGDPD